MFKVVLFLGLLAIVGFHLQNADGCEVKSYRQKLVPACDNNDLKIKWPNYEDQTKYYSCAQVNNPKLITCPIGQVFVYVLQKCKSCDQYLPAVDCSKLPTQNRPVCVNINAESGSGSAGPVTITYPTPRYPSPATTTSASSDNTTTTSDATDSSVEPNSDFTDSSTISTTVFPGPPSPQATGGTTRVPIPPTPAPTPPSIELEPPTASE